MSLNITIHLLDQIHTLAKAAGDEILKIYDTDFVVQNKADKSPVTAADRIADTLICETIRTEVTDHFPIISEESYDETGAHGDLSSSPFWLIDPLDGTKEFINRNGEFTVNIALIENGLPVLGVVHVPVSGRTYLGSPHGAFVEKDAAGPQPISARTPPPQGLVAVVSRSHKNQETEDYLADFSIQEEVTAGSSLKFCMIAEGRADLYPRFGRTMEWDTAAGHGVLRHAGGDVRKQDGGVLTYGKAGFENPFFIARGRS
ncbi:3'(2'),5'-bisphosphate nucleotidase CysQ [Varunaivibrio sulfuroxidans]|uniref:3'(2'),5'-bisphosphate nucleotidase CysQ n=1 Tax=Varunaivibrio sulfuroxidans TaxID=1773489 RepID=A0A4R3J6N0_9PROT|nr:3'(2'),5'-bisphosphate nucleotidase CysQ [Varunaivibrio sulfuroxidans]TCS60110.1 3'(2'),5'-bisphosphate nucleotidase [Varunaivibrio sulfuroxidans]WES30917.1 3'(2'),5'-bisphosphate nucleotidase CysQ [Varunaivibrio sulfuroxidans]